MASSGVQYYYHQVLGKVHLKVSNRQCLPHLHLPYVELEGRGGGTITLCEKEQMVDGLKFQ